LGPDLTHVAARLGGQPGLTAALTTIAFPTMAGPFLNRPLAAAESADLVAFLVQADQQQPPVPLFAAGAVTPLMWLILGLAVGGGVALYLLLSLFWPRQRQSIAVRLRSSGRSRKA
jgi:hypothetical protein